MAQPQGLEAPVNRSVRSSPREEKSEPQLELELPLMKTRFCSRKKGLFVFLPSMALICPQFALNENSILFEKKRAFCIFALNGLNFHQNF
jgi:hypothetical protein